MYSFVDVEEKFGRTWTDSVSWTIFQVVPSALAPAPPNSKEELCG